LHRYTKADSDKFLRYFQKEVQLLAEYLEGFKFKNIHLGGGTPNLIDPKLIITPLHKLVDFHDLSRFVVEVAPREGLSEYLGKLEKHSVTKIQLGVQTLNENLLKQENRAISRDTIMECMETLSQTNLIWSVDLIYGFDNEDKFQRNYIEELQALLPKGPLGFHLYTIRSEGVNRFYGMGDDQNKYFFSYRKTMDELKDFINVQKTLIDKGYELVYDEFCIGPNVNHAQLAISFNARTGVFPNMIGIGLGAYGHTRIMRYRNVKELDDYALLLDKKKMPLGQSSDFSANHLYPVSMIYNQIKKGAEMNLLRFAHSVSLSDEEKEEINNLLRFLDDRGVEYILDNGTLIIPPFQYSLCLYTINEYVEWKSQGTYSLILD
jgi:coproporphyrinogen III oxidase-like Fe-S oxidoreductase